ncbi:MAG TPA: hypothetical protein VN238_05445 [Solirubrobacteraceae bacterium]|nr:hypothetical protein [Solirubrobacteraceae bacterium]
MQKLREWFYDSVVASSRAGHLVRAVLVLVVTVWAFSHADEGRWLLVAIVGAIVCVLQLVFASKASPETAG